MNKLPYEYWYIKNTIHDRINKEYNTLMIEISIRQPMAKYLAQDVGHIKTESNAKHRAACCSQSEVPASLPLPMFLELGPHLGW